MIDFYLESLVLREFFFIWIDWWYCITEGWFRILCLVDSVASGIDIQIGYVSAHSNVSLIDAARTDRGMFGIDFCQSWTDGWLNLVLLSRTLSCGQRFNFTLYWINFILHNIWIEKYVFEVSVTMSLTFRIPCNSHMWWGILLSFRYVEKYLTLPS